jgi:hypothetical protein
MNRYLYFTDELIYDTKAKIWCREVFGFVSSDSLEMQIVTSIGDYAIIRQSDCTFITQENELAYILYRRPNE